MYPVPFNSYSGFHRTWKLGIGAMKVGEDLVTGRGNRTHGVDRIEIILS
jgi:hypothetical protein